MSTAFFSATHLSTLLFSTLLTTYSLGFSSHSCALDHDPELIPIENLPTLWQVVLPNGESLSADVVAIDSLGAVGTIPWSVHVPELTVYSLPNVDAGTTIGIELKDAQLHGEYYLVEQSDEEWLKISHNNQVGWVSVSGLNRVHPINEEMLSQQPNLEIGKEIINRWWGIPISYEPNDLVNVPTSYTNESESHDYQLREEAALAVIAMIDAARADGMNFFVASPYRSGTLQQRIYLRNIKRAGRNQRFSAPPGHSEHQLGLTIDFSSPTTKKFLTNNDPQHAWLMLNGERFGFRQTYTATNIAETGYVEEPWHWRYVGVEKKQTAWVFCE